MLKDNLITIQNKIDQHKAADQTVQLLAVSKKHSVDKIRTAYNLGIRLFGENYLQEALEKIQQLQDLTIEWHFIGQIQSKKCADIAKHFHWVQTLDRLKVAQLLNQHAEKSLNVLIQVNIDEDLQKGGLKPTDVEPFARDLAQFKNLKLRGLMCMPAIKESVEANRASFEAMQHIYMSMRDAGFQLDTLSMGMTQDYTVAVQCGSNLVRVGSGLFGARD